MEQKTDIKSLTYDEVSELVESWAKNVFVGNSYMSGCMYITWHLMMR